MSVAWQLADLANVKPSGLRAISTFSCGDGSSMGYRLAGFDVQHACDIDTVVARHYQANLNPANLHVCPINELVSRLPPNAYGIDLLDGSPPCSTFSMAGSREQAWGVEKKFREGQKEQVLSDLFFDFLDVAEAIRPRAIIAENVTGIAHGLAKGYLALIFERLHGIGYRPQAFKVDASRCGVPQKRERVYIVAQRDDAPRHDLILEPRSALISAAEACADIQELSDEERIASAPTELDLAWWDKTTHGKSYTHAIEAEGGRRKAFNNVRLDGSKPAATLPAQSSAITHWSERRKLTFREYKRLSSFPDDYAAESERLGKYIVGMSVPPRMAEFVGAAVRDQWLS